MAKAALAVSDREKQTGVTNQVHLMLELHDLERSRNGARDLDALRRVERELDASLLRDYRKLRERKRTAIAVLEDGVCSECKMIYPDGHDVCRYDNFIHICEYCGRFLVVPDKGEAHSFQRHKPNG